MPVENESLTMTVEEAAKALGISRGLAYDLARQRKIPIIRLGKRMIIPRKALEDMLSGNWQPAKKEDD